MSAPRPGDLRLGRHSLRTFKHALRGAAAWSVAPACDPDRLRAAWHAWGLC